MKRLSLGFENLLTCLLLLGLLALRAMPVAAGTFAYVANGSGNTVSGYTVNATTGALTSIAGSPFATGAFPRSVAVDPTGTFAYVANAIGNTVSGYTISATTGALTPIAGSPFATGTGPFSVAVDPTGKFAYVANFGGTTVSGYTISATTGALTPIAGSPFATGAVPVSVAVDPTGTFAYVANESANTVSGYTINATTGALTPITGSPFAAGAGPTSVTVTTVATPTVLFAAFTATLDLTLGPSASQDVFDLNGTFTLGASSNGIAPLTEAVSLTLAGGTGSVTVTVTIPAGSFTAMKNGAFVFRGTLNSVALKVRIAPEGANTYSIEAEGTGADLTGFANPVTVTLTIGDDSGTITVTAQIH